MGVLEQADWGVFKRSETWKAFGIAIVLFTSIAYAGLSLFDSMDEIFQSDAEPAPIPEIVIDSLNRSDIEANYTNGDGSIPMDNPFINVKNAIKSIWTYGNRNPQGLAIHPISEIIFESEHG